MRIKSMRLYLNKGLFLDYVGREFATVNTTSVDTEGLFVLTNFWAGGVPIDYKGWAFPFFCPCGCFRCIRPFGCISLLVDYLNVHCNFDWLRIPGRIWQETAMDKDYVTFSVEFEFG